MKKTLKDFILNKINHYIDNYLADNNDDDDKRAFNEAIRELIIEINLDGFDELFIEFLIQKKIDYEKYR